MFPFSARRKKSKFCSKLPNHRQSGTLPVNHTQVANHVSLIDHDSATSDRKDSGLSLSWAFRLIGARVLSAYYNIACRVAEGIMGQR